ncbi:hypothetical protein CONLIGDRAFT_645463 [Coniochaeta ligniaria NRRL 30616]|uniref:Uncharacterized protein n=1 Tax=Coniochaeta ligniaria NRRL 30616 TaxID=1408157 RepID=A0A1J7II74_9PEZI|nr:hypothetical protein CONLIGDRAFT_645463 [Coniochaeta ligniaria NRRL 30616]
MSLGFSALWKPPIAANCTTRPGSIESENRTVRKSLTAFEPLRLAHGPFYCSTYARHEDSIVVLAKNGLGTGPCSSQLDWRLALSVLDPVTAMLASGDAILRTHVVRLRDVKQCWHDVSQACVSELFNNGEHTAQHAKETKKRATPWTWFVRDLCLDSAQSVTSAMARKQSLISRLVLFSLLYPSCAWATTNNEVTTGDLSRRQILPRNGLIGQNGPTPRAEDLWRKVETEVLQIVEEQIKVIVAREPHHQHRRGSPPSPAARAPQTPQITPPPSLALFARQNDAQIQQLSGQIQSISQSFRSVSQASQQVSQSSQQLSNSLQQAQQQLSQTAQSLASARASADSARQSADAANQAAQQASRDADQARQSADQAVTSAQSSASAAAEAASRSAASSAANSVASVMAAMSTSAQQVMSSAASLVQAAKADATAVRTEADNRVLQAQGAAVSVTQAALAIVGAIIGSSLLTVAAFVFVLRYKRRRRVRRSLAVGRSRGGDSIGYPGLQGSSTGVGGGDYEKGSYGVDIKEPEPTAVQTQRVGFATAIGANRASFHLKTPPKGKYSVFPKSREASAGQQQQGDVEAGSSPTSQYSLDNEKEKAQSEAAARQSRLDSPPSLDKWLRAGTTVSPFGTLNVITGGQKKQMMTKNNWPLARNGSS